MTGNDRTASAKSSSPHLRHETEQNYSLRGQKVELGEGQGFTASFEDMPQRSESLPLGPTSSLNTLWEYSGAPKVPGVATKTFMNGL